ncbi:trafficking protein particle complex subunit 6b (macronuclear) [Tetrahymena thermophila SB210]|uniref:Trafficking protein particle complex subunit 6b n=1 Tax=Tetrahymena thermophila (strain SB210) TaxID=312017 RepID=I7MI05_TETTS|nr:trafficking protein particle complex subunit 6b [Tetrahymena thermophila SB210]EAS03791.1 trafficking protein particle complex subunit 6b [Tetrahymena thermophila SB210]|eukprot:XP_001024036.1 trafficking protein particle complex subunit 6b [Tetrahymena thermophila SB210]
MMNFQRQQDINAVDFFGYYHLMNQFVIRSCKDQLTSIQVKQNSLFEVGYKIGRSVVEKITENCLDKFKEDVEKNNAKCLPQIKFISKDFWSYLFQKDVDKANHNLKGTFYLKVFTFTMFEKLSNTESPEVQEFVSLWYQVIRGLVAGAMKGLSYPSEVSVDSVPPEKPDHIQPFMISIQILNYPALLSSQIQQK